jgi:phage-related protein
MADERHIIDIILKARDDTGGALASAAAKLGLLKDQQKAVQEAADKTGRSFEEMSRRISTGQARLVEEQRKLGDSTGQTLDAQVKLEQASRAYVKTLNDANASEAQRTQSLRNLRAAQGELALSITRIADEEAKAADAASKATAKRIQEAATELERIKALRAYRAEAVKEQAKHDADRARSHANLMRTLDAAERDSAQRRQRWREDELKQILDREKREQQAAEETARKRRELASTLDRSEREAEQRRIANAERELRQIQQIERARRESAQRLQAERERELRLGREYVQQIQQVQRIEQERRRAAEGGDFAVQAQLEFDAQSARAQAAELAVELRTLFSNIEANMDLDDAAFKAHAAEVLAMKQLLGRDIEIDVDIDVGNLDRARALAEVVDDVGDNSNRTSRSLGFLGGLVRSVGDGFEGGSARIASFDNYLRGLLSLGIALFFNQLFLLAGAAAGALAALASSAAMAGAAIGGSLVAGITQALPVLGVFATALSRVAAITEAVQQANLLQQQQSYQGASAARAQANAQDAVVAASERVRDANERIVEAQQDVNNARQAGIEKLRELILEEKGLSLTVEETEAAIRRQAAAGDTSAIPRSLLRRDEARQQLAAVRGQVQERRQMASSGEGSPELQEAKEQLEDAVQAGKQAERALEQSKRSAAEAADGVTAAQGKLAFLLAGLSDAERRLYNAIIRLQEVWRSFSQEVSEPLINAFAFAVDRVIVLLQNPEIRAAFTALSTTMAEQFRRIFSAFTDRESIGQLLRFVAQARQNLKPLTDIAINIGQAFLDIGEAAAPALRRIIIWVRDISENVREFFASGRKSGELTDFFEKGVDHLKAWGDLLWEVIRLFAAIAGPGGGASSGLKMLRSMADTIRGWADAINDTDSKTNEFFQRFFRLSRKMLEAMAPVFTAIANEIDKTFTKDGLRAVKGFATFLADILIPALGDFARFIGRGTAALGEFTKQHPLFAQIVSSILAASLAFGILSKLLSVFGPIIAPLRFIAIYLGRAVGATNALQVAMRVLMGFVGWPLVIIAGIALLLAKLGLLDDLMRAFGKFFTAIWKEIRGPVERAADTFKKLFDAVGEGNGVFAVLKPVLKTIIDLLGIFMESIGKAIGKVLGGLIDMISGVVEVVVSLLSGDFKGAWEGIKRIVKGAVSVVTGVFKDLPNAVWNVINEGFRRVFRFFRNLPDRLWELVKGIPEKLAGAFTGLGGLILEGIVSGVEGVASFGKNIVNAVIALVEDAVNSVDKIGIISVPDISFPRLQEGGPIGSGYGGGDRRLILAEDGEHMITKEEVRNAGGHGAIFALRRLLGGGRQGGPWGFQEGGAVAGAAQLGLSVEGNVARFGAQWSRMWEQIVAVGQGGVRVVNRLFAQMAARIDNIMNRIERSSRRTWGDLIETATTRGNRLERVFANTFGEVSDVVFRGLRYVGNATNDVLKSLNADPLKLSLNAPRKATGGVIGQWGERGRDSMLTMLGAGEAVLNWGQQALVNALLPGQTTLQSLIASSYGYHAGGPGSSPGFATGRDAIVSVPGFPGEMAARKILDEIAYYTKRFGLILTDAFGPGHKSPGHTVYGTAADLAGSDRDMDRAVQALVRAGYKVLYDGRFGSIAWPGHGPSTVAGDNAHIHVEFGDLSRNLPGGDVSIKRARVEGPDGPLKAIAQALIDRVRSKANDLLESMVVTTDDEGYEYFDIEGGMSVAKTIHEVWQKMGLPFKALLSAIETGIVESGLKNLPGGDQDSVGWRQERSHYGSQEERMNVGRGAQRFFQEWKQFADAGESAGEIAAQVQRPAAQYRGRYDQAQGAAMKVISGLGVNVPDQFAEGGEIRGGGFGEPVNIIGHVGEWVVNQSQQSALATMLGTSVGKLRDLLGFSGGPTSFQGGGDIRVGRSRVTEGGRYIAPAVDPRGLEAIEKEIDQVFEAVRRLSKSGKVGSRISRFLRAIRNLTDDGGMLEQMGEAFERLSARLDTGLALAQAGLRRRGGRLIERARGLLTSPQEIATITIENLDKLNDQLRDQRSAARRGLSATERRLESIRRGGVRESERDEFVQLVAARNKFIDTMNDLDSQIAENRTARYQARLERFQANLADAERGIELQQRDDEFASRRLDISERLGGDRLGNIRARQALSVQRATTLGNERQMLETFLRRATRLGDTDAINDLTDRLAENAVALEEETAARRELVYTYRQTATDIIAGRQERSTGLIGTASGLIQRLGEISGNLNINQIRGFLEQTAQVLASAGVEIATNISQAIGEDLFSGSADNVLTQLRNAFTQGPESFATALAALGPSIANLESTMSETERTAFQALIQSMIDNTTAVVDNTGQLEELTDTAVQQWSSTAWQWFREAVFTGMGTVLPEYDVPQMQTGGHVTRGGLFRLHTGEFVVNPERSNIKDGDISITVNEAGRPLDVTHLANRIAFEKKSRRR